ncbi:MAG: hypothetical protein JO316_24940 [Abitibacteriaceae bacterium]|nr:hypothetical protein [Abditibacteriaceae bacterium]MBV9868615.1 hypothetical protein [Abditibacteriaceae bacterium]
MARITKKQIKEAASVLKRGDSKKRERQEAASIMSAIGSSKGGQARAENLSSEERSEIARKGGLARQAQAREKKEALARQKAERQAKRAAKK